MKSFRCKITEQPDQHARLAGLLVKKSIRYASAVSVSANNKLGNAKRILSIMSMGIIPGDEILIEAEGPDEARAVVELAEFFKNNM